jgi:hypothetical protein
MALATRGVELTVAASQGVLMVPAPGRFTALC